MKIREMRNEEIMLLTEFLYEAIFQRDEKNRLPRTIIQDPSLWIYIEHFGSKKDDHCLAAEVDGMIVGAIWSRCIPAFGSISDTVPELALSVYPEYRGKGIGTELIKEMISYLKRKGYDEVSLAVQKDNYALRMYENAGFLRVSENEQEYIMVCKLK